VQLCRLEHTDQSARDVQNLVEESHLVRPQKQTDQVYWLPVSGTTQQEERMKVEVHVERMEDKRDPYMALVGNF
jgi:hypothetical protein